MEYENTDTDQYRVVINQAGQYSILAVEQQLPPGWRAVGISGARAACLDHIESVWTDMNPTLTQIQSG